MGVNRLELRLLDFSRCRALQYQRVRAIVSVFPMTISRCFPLPVMDLQLARRLVFAWNSATSEARRFRDVTPISRRSKAIPVVNIVPPIGTFSIDSDVAIMV
ncbi:hypothetical protein PILCRDRAFT_723876 [Piloderma croceum F 1598]|uniref:Uncharacterized protein n=1 Tax=Piloderma croceum (strain F 1598) TaxID=765440 RepID=A0A0C3F153_PILCF|nr:hypothetical protein PILCRDRAFT_723876 [Piloderma croceum F 1598]